MKKINILLVMLLMIGTSVMAQKTAFNANDYASFGEKFKVNRVYNKAEMMKKYKKLKKGDTLVVQFESEIKSVCKKKGCWMKLALKDDNNSFVKFKDYAFFVPLNADNSPAIVSGKAFVDVESVEELRHYAKDAGKSKEEIAKITKPETTYAFMADGVYIKK